MRATERVQFRMVSTDIEPVASAPAEAARNLEAGIVKWVKVITAAKVEPERGDRPVHQPRPSPTSLLMRLRMCPKAPR